MSEVENSILIERARISDLIAKVALGSYFPYRFLLIVTPSLYASLIQSKYFKMNEYLGMTMIFSSDVKDWKLVVEI